MQAGNVFCGIVLSFLWFYFVGSRVWFCRQSSPGTQYVAHTRLEIALPSYLASWMLKLQAHATILSQEILKLQAHETTLSQGIGFQSKIWGSVAYNTFLYRTHHMNKWKFNILCFYILHERLNYCTDFLGQVRWKWVKNYKFLIVTAYLLVKESLDVISLLSFFPIKLFILMYLLRPYF